MAPKRVLVTGATGQIGNALYTRLKQAPDVYDVYALDRSETFSTRVPGSWAHDVPADRFFHVDLSDMDGLRSAIEGMDVVAHLAADPSPNSWESVLQNNVIGTHHVFEACRLAGVKRVVAASSIMVSEGHWDQEPNKAITERRYADVPQEIPRVSPAMPAEPRSLYGCSKVWSESLARTYAHKHGMSCIAIRIGKVERDRPRPPGGASIYVSVRDIVQIWQRSIDAPETLRFGIYYGLSTNDWR